MNEDITDNVQQPKSIINPFSKFKDLEISN